MKIKTLLLITFLLSSVSFAQELNGFESFVFEDEDLQAELESEFDLKVQSFASVKCEDKTYSRFPITNINDFNRATPGILSYLAKSGNNDVTILISKEKTFYEKIFARVTSRRDAGGFTQSFIMLLSIPSKGYIFAIFCK